MANILVACFKSKDKFGRQGQPFFQTFVYLSECSKWEGELQTQKDHELMLAVKEGNLDALAPLFEKYHKRLYNLFLYQTQDAAVSEDLVQDVLVKLYPKRREIGQVEKIRPWLIKILYNTFIDQKRRANRSPLSLLKTNNKEDGQDILETIPTEHNGPEENTVKNQARLQIMKAINSLNENQRHLCILHDVEGYTLNELEEILDTPIGTLKSRLHRARANLRKLIKKETFLGS